MSLSSNRIRCRPEKGYRCWTPATRQCPLKLGAAGENRSGRCSRASLSMPVRMSGNRAVKSWPCWVNSRTPATSLRARIRKPSCLISCNQFGPDGPFRGRWQARLDKVARAAATYTNDIRVDRKSRPNGLTDCGRTDVSWHGAAARRSMASADSSTLR